MSEAVMVAAYPMFPCVDVGAGVAFYEGRLGFTTVFRQGEEYARVQRDSVILDLWKCTDPAMKGNEPGCRLMVENIDELFQEFSAAIPSSAVDGPRPTVTPIEVKPWGMKEFAILDPDNNVLHVGERVP